MKKQLISGAVAATAAFTGAGVTSVHAQDTTVQKAEEIKPVVEKAETKLAQTEQAKSEAEQAAKTAASKADVAKEIVRKADETRMAKAKVVSAGRQAADDAIKGQLIADAKAADEAKSAYEKAVQDASDAKAAVDQATADAQAKQATKEEAQKVLDEAQKAVADADAEKTSVTTADAEAAVKSAQSALDSARSGYAQAQKKADDAKTSKESTDKALAKAKADAEAAKTAQAQAQKDYDEAKKAESDAQAAYDALSDETKKAEMQQKLDEAKKAVSEKQQAVADAQKKAEDAQAGVAKAQESCDKAAKALEEVQAGVTKAQESVKEAEKNTADAEASLQEARDAVKAAEQKVAEAQDKAKNAQSRMDEIDKEIADADAQIAKLSERQKDYEEVREVYRSRLDKADEEFNKGLLGFLLSGGLDDECEKSIKAIFNTKQKVYDEKGNEVLLTSYTNMGAKGDATYLPNVYKAIDMLKEQNEIRKSLGLGELQVSYKMMAYSAVQANYSAHSYDHTVNHMVRNGEGKDPSYKRLGENLAWGCKDPFAGWYYIEKAAYDKINKGNYDMEAVRKAADLENLTEDDIMGMVDEYVKTNHTGHYKNIIRSDCLIAGAAHSDTADTDEVSFHYTDSLGNDDSVQPVDILAKNMKFYQHQVDKNVIQGDIDEMTERIAKNADEIKALQDRKSTLESEKASIANIQQTIADAQKELDDANGNVKTAQAGVKDATKATEEAEAALKKAQDMVPDAQENATEAQKSLDASKEAVANAQKAVESAEAEVSSAQDEVSRIESLMNSSDEGKALNALNAAKDASAKAEAALESAEQASTEASEAQNAAQAKADEVAASIQKTAKEESDAEKAQKTAETALKSAQEAVKRLAGIRDARDTARISADEAAKAEAEAKKALADAKAASDSKSEKASQAKKALEAANAVLASSQAVSDAWNGGKDFTASDEIMTLVKAYRQAADEANASESEYRKAKNDYDQAAHEASEAADAYTRAQDAYKKALDKALAGVKYEEQRNEEKVQDDTDTSVSARVTAKDIVESLSQDQYVSIYNALRSGDDVTAKVLVSRDSHVASDASALLDYAKKNGLTPVDYFELGIQIQTGDKDMVISRLAHPVAYTMDLGGISTANRRFYVLRLHDGSIEKLPVEVNGPQGMFQTDSFSTYMLAYENVMADENASGTKTVSVKGADAKVTAGRTKAGTKTGTKSAKVSADTAKASGAKEGRRVVDTGDYTAVFETLALAGASLLGIVATRKKAEDNQ